MVWAWKGRFCSFGIDAISNSGFRFCNQLTYDSVIYAISELDGERSTGHSNWKYGVANVVCIVLQFCFTNFLLPYAFFEYLQSHSVIAN
jgi:hypothetical protein